jgi:hypothetical protein
MSTRNDIIRCLPFADLTAVQVCGGMEPGWKKESVIEEKEIPQVGALSLGRQHDITEGAICRVRRRGLARTLVPSRLPQAESCRSRVLNKLALALAPRAGFFPQ